MPLNLCLIKHHTRLTYRYIQLLSIAILLLLNGKVKGDDLPKLPSPIPDSLAAVLANLPTDSAKVETLLLVSDALLFERPDSAQLILKEALSISEAGNTPYGQTARTKLKLAATHSDLENFDLSSALIFEVIELYEANGDSVGKARAIKTLGRNYLMMGELEVGLDYTLRALEIFERQNDSANFFPAYQNITQTYARLSMIDSARYFYQKAQQHLDHFPIFMARSSSHQAFGIACRYAGMLDSSNYYFHLAIQDLEPEASPSLRGQIYSSIGINYRVNKQPDSALYYMKKSEAIERTLPDNHWKFNLYSEYSRIYEDLGECDTALEYFKLFDSIHAIIYYDQRLQEVKALEVRYQVNQKEQQNQLLAQQTELQTLQLSQRNSYIIILLLSIALAGIIVFWGIRRILHRARNREVDLEQRALRSQMNPHFMFNALSSIQHIVYNNDKLFAITNISVFAKLMRTVLNQSDQDKVSVSEEMETLKLYLSLEALRFEDRYQFDVSADESIIPDQYFVPPLLIQPIVENAIKHGLLNQEPPGGKVTITFSLENQKLKCVIEDDGVGRDRATKIRSQHNPNHRSFATQSVKQRIELLNKQKNSKITYLTEDLMENGKAKGTRVTLIFPQK